MNEIELESKVMSSSMNKKFLIATLSNVAFPEVIIKEVVKPALKASLPVQRSGIDILIDLVYKVEGLLWKTEKAGVTGSSIRTQLIRRFKERIPPLDDILSFWKYEMSVSELDGEYLCKTAKILDFYLNFLRLECDAVENLLSDIQKLNKSVETNKATLFFLKYQASSFTIKNHFNDNYIEILFNVALKSEDENLRNLSTTTLYQIFGIQNGLTKRSVEFEIFLSVCRENGSKLLHDYTNS
ncbi:unnamed protein product [Lepeophtheirus salmonis]|uniref:(salmon louse) hypothetical protein n=1 Tax=Lepeophtheirus salmonis TaxID=72036 RepID=A0A7R8H911_LEPSM|nr:unnamed protein product [Lepeophtheirus salmonis]CAF2932178.1 unnamed protein product [Lepeophtheirus salmonis]